MSPMSEMQESQEKGSERMLLQAGVGIIERLRGGELGIVFYVGPQIIGIELETDK